MPPFWNGNRNGQMRKLLEGLRGIGAGALMLACVNYLPTQKVFAQARVQTE